MYLLELGGLDAEGDKIDKAVISGKVHLCTIYEEDEEDMRLNFPNIVFTYDVYKPTPIRTIPIKVHRNNSSL